jgi:alkanesulfonate monooxygenase SsuD/methylene tetrahydromethanopterin reductase-like flavin-dependent oxidoreductase (luciferase family)
VRLGYFSLNTEDGISPAVLAREMEERGFDSIWLAEHSHIPVVRKPTAAFGEDVPDGYLHLMDPYVSLATAATTTTTLLLGTGVSMVLEHDLLDLACRVASLDVLSGGRVRFGVGAGWLPEELGHHRPDVPFASR